MRTEIVLLAVGMVLLSATMRAADKQNAAGQRVVKKFVCPVCGREVVKDLTAIPNETSRDKLIRELVHCPDCLYTNFATAFATRIEPAAALAALKAELDELATKRAPGKANLIELIRLAYIGNRAYRGAANVTSVRLLQMGALEASAVLDFEDGGWFATRLRDVAAEMENSALVINDFQMRLRLWIAVADSFRKNGLNGEAGESYGKVLELITEGEKKGGRDGDFCRGMRPNIVADAELNRAAMLPTDELIVRIGKLDAQALRLLPFLPGKYKDAVFRKFLLENADGPASILSVECARIYAMTASAAEARSVLLRWIAGTRLKHREIALGAVSRHLDTGLLRDAHKIAAGLTTPLTPAERSILDDLQRRLYDEAVKKDG